MRNLTEREVEIINSDIIPFEKFLIQNGLYSSVVEQKYTRIKFGIESKQVLKRANGITNKDGSIAISDFVFYNDNEQRARTIYHEIGHAIFGISILPEDASTSLVQEVVNIQNENKSEFSLDTIVYLRGLNCLEEYLAEKFEQTVSYYAKGINVPPRVNLSTPGICGDYKYFSTFKSNYGIFESQCDTIITKIFGSINNAIRAAFNDEYFSSFFHTQDKITIMKILGNLGQIYGAIQKYHGYERTGVEGEFDPKEIKKLLEETTKMANNLPQQTIQQTSIGRSIH